MAPLTPAELGGVAAWAHIGGFVAGAAVCWVARRRGRDPKPWA